MTCTPKVRQKTFGVLLCLNYNYKYSYVKQERRQSQELKPPPSEILHLPHDPLVLSGKILTFTGLEKQKQVI